MYLVCAESGRIHAEIGKRERHFPQCLNGVTVKEGSDRVRQFCQFGNWLDDAGFVVCKLHRYESRSRFDCLTCGGKVYDSVWRDRQERDVKSKRLKPLGGVEDRLVFDSGDNDATSHRMRVRKCLKYPVVSLCRSRGEENLIRIDAKHIGNSRARRFHSTVRDPAREMSALSVTKRRCPKWSHRSNDLRGTCSCCIVVEVNKPLWNRYR